MIKIKEEPKIEFDDLYKNPCNFQDEITLIQQGVSLQVSQTHSMCLDSKNNVFFVGLQNQLFTFNLTFLQRMLDKTLLKKSDEFNKEDCLAETILPFNIHRLFFSEDTRDLILV